MYIRHLAMNEMLRRDRSKLDSIAWRLADFCSNFGLAIMPGAPVQAWGLIKRSSWTSSIMIESSDKTSYCAISKSDSLILLLSVLALTLFLAGV